VPDSLRHPRRVYGVDFSGAAGAGERIWIAQAAVIGDALAIEACHRGMDLPGSGPERDRCLPALRDLVGREESSAFGLDFPFGLPRELIMEDSWENFVLGFRGRYSDPESFRAQCRAATGGAELKRRTDRESRTPFSAYNLRLYRQTYYGIRDVLAPMIQDRRVCVLPMQPAQSGRPWLMEICPASTLKHEGISMPYKGRGGERYAARARILKKIEGRAPLSIPTALRRLILDDYQGDALDSVLAAYAVFRTLRDSVSLATASHSPYELEGYVYI